MNVNGGHQNNRSGVRSPRILKDVVVQVDW